MELLSSVLKIATPNAPEMLRTSARIADASPISSLRHDDGDDVCALRHTEAQREGHDTHRDDDIDRRGTRIDVGEQENTDAAEKCARNIT